MPAQPDQSLTGVLTRLGSAIGNSSLHRYLFGTEEGRQVATIVALGLIFLGVWTATILYRRSSWSGMQAAYESPRKMLAWHGPWRGPLLAASISALVVLVFPVYLPRMARFRPSGWPDWGTLAPKFAFVGIAVAAVWGIVALVLGIRRSLHEKVVVSSHGDAAWASRSDVYVPAKARVVAPFLVSYRGTTKDWRQGIQSERPRNAVEAFFREVGRFVPNVQTAGLVPLAPSDQTLWEHVLITGHTGSAKGMGLFNPFIYSATLSKTPFVYQDFKAECPGHAQLWEATGEEPIRFGRAAKGGWPSMRWSALREALGDENPAMAVSDLLAVLAPNEGGDDFVSPPTRNVLSHLILEASYQNFHEIRDDVMNKGLMELMTNTKAPAGLVNALSGKNMEQYITDKLFAVTTPYSVGWGRAVSSGHDFRIADVFRRGGYVLSAEPNEMLALPIKVFWRFLLRHALQSAPDTKFKFLMFFDEFLAAGKIDDLGQALNTLRSREVSIWAGIQARSGVLNNYQPVEGKSVLDGFKSEILLLNGLTIDDREHLMKFLGTRTIVEGRGQQRGFRGAPLISVADLNRRASRKGDFWAVCRVIGLTRSGRPLLAKAIPTVGRDFVKTPTPEQLAEALVKYGNAPTALTQQEQKEVQMATVCAGPITKTPSAQGPEATADPAPEIPEERPPSEEEVALL